MKITKRQLRRIIREYKSISFPERNAGTLELASELEAVYETLRLLKGGVAGSYEDSAREIEASMKILSSVIYRLGGSDLK